MFGLISTVAVHSIGSVTLGFYDLEADGRLGERRWLVSSQFKSPHHKAICSLLDVTSRQFSLEVLSLNSAVYVMPCF